jgi:nucleoside-diphosphate-sugar epimerase
VESPQHRTRILVAGAGGAIGAAVCDDLARDHDVIALVGSEFRMGTAEPRPWIEWRSCEPFSRPDVEAAMAGCEYVVYLVHTRVSTARLDQAACEDMDLLIADNVARAASRHGVRQIVHLGRLGPPAGAGRARRDRSGEIRDALGFYGTPVTTLRAGLVVAPGSSMLKLLAAATRPRVVLVPKWAAARRQPIAVGDVIRGMRFCLGNASTLGREFDVGGPATVDFRELLRQAARVLGRHPAIVTVPLFTRRLYLGYLRLLDRSSHPALLRLAVENLGTDAVVKDNPVQRFVVEGATSPRDLVDASLGSSGEGLLSNPRDASSADYLADVRARRRVRSIQRLELPPGWNAASVADHYFRWLPGFNLHLVKCAVDEHGSCRVSSRIPRLVLLELGFQPGESSPGSRLYLITGGLLARGQVGGRPRMEFRDVQGGRQTIVAIHDFAPQLPWLLYRATQAAIHLVVMRAFQRHMARLASRPAAAATAARRSPP